MLHEPPTIKQFVKQLLHLNYPNHTQSVERAVKMTTTASGRIAGSKRQIGEALCTIAGRKKAMDRKKNTTSQKKLLRLIGVARIFDWGGPKPQITSNDVIKNFRKSNFLWGKDIVEWKI